MVELLQLFASVTVSVYVPAFEFCATAITVFCEVELNPFGPVQLYEVPPPPLRLIGCNKQTGLLLAAVGVGSAFTTALYVVLFVQVPTVTTSVYVPALKS